MNSSKSTTPESETTPPLQPALPINHEILRSLIEKNELRKKPISNTPNERHWEDKKEYDREKAIQYRVERLRGFLDPQDGHYAEVLARFFIAMHKPFRQSAKRREMLGEFAYLLEKNG